MSSQSEPALLTEAQVVQFQQNGFVTVDRITTVEEIQQLALVYDDLFASSAAFADGDRIDLAGDGLGAALPQIVNPERYAPQLLDGAAFANAQRIAVQLLGTTAASMGNHAIMKPAHHGVPTPWHQDEAYWDVHFRYRAISVWIPLQAATLENGCMQFVPGSHRREVLSHELIDAVSHGLRLADPTETALCSAMSVPCPLPAGGATIHDGRTLHYAGPNASEHPRRALIFAFQCPPVQLETPRSAPWQRSEWFAQ